MLEALVIKDMPTVNTAKGFRPSLMQPLACEWVKIDEVNPAGDTLRAEAQAKGAAIFSRGEGAWFGNGKIYFVCSNGGDAGRGQVFAYDPAARECRDRGGRRGQAADGTLTLFFESVPAAELPYADPSWNSDSVDQNGGFVLAAPEAPRLQALGLSPRSLPGPVSVHRPERRTERQKAQIILF